MSFQEGTVICFFLFRIQGYILCKYYGIGGGGIDEDTGKKLKGKKRILHKNGVKSLKIATFWNST